MMNPDPIPLARPAGRIRGWLGLRQALEVEGVWYREATHESLKRALSRKGTRRKEYTVTFPDGSRVHIAATRERHFADLSGPRLLLHYRRAESLVRPGMRVVALGTGTGYAGAWLASMVGPFGAVTALEEDEQSVMYARKRYPRANVAFDLGGVAALAGEPDGAFEFAFAVEAIRVRDDDAAILGELVRVVAPGGHVFIVAPAHGSGEADTSDTGPRPYTTDELVSLARRCSGIHAPEPGLAGPAGSAPDGPALLIRKADRGRGTTNDHG